MIKRLFEIIFSLVVLILGSPIILVSSIFIFFEDFHNPFFLQKRLGKDKKVFIIFKLRTMRANVPQVGTHEVSKDLYLKSSKYIRKLKIDELPQFLNVLLGNMTIVGPRPCLPNQSRLIKARDKYKIFKFKPGITGISQLLNIMMDQESIQAKTDSIYLSKKGNDIFFYIYCIANTVFKFDRDLNYLKRMN